MNDVVSVLLAEQDMTYPVEVTDNQQISVELDVAVNVGDLPPVLITKYISENGIYDAESDNADGYSSVDVNVEMPTPVLISKNIIENGIYDAESDNADGYSSVDVNVEQGLIIPAGFGYYNGYLLPILPVIEGYDHVWIRMNNATGEYNAIYGNSEWYATGSSSLASWSLTFANQTTVLSRQYDCPQSNPTAWIEGTPSANNYGTGSDRKPIWSNSDIYTSSAKNAVLYKQGFAITA